MAPPCSIVDIYHAPPIKGPESAKLSMKRILDALNDEKIRVIGIYGMRGVGKTTLVRNVNNHLKGTLNFSRVIMVAVSKEVDLKRVQNDIAKRLGLDLKDESVSRKATQLMKRLMEEEKFLIIFDDLWARIEQANVGIPSSEHHKAFKIIFTSRSEDVCKKMEADFKIRVELLSKDESWKLFKAKAGKVVDYPTLHTVAEKVANECRGLPLAIVTAGRALNDEKSFRVWNHALSELKKSAPKNIRGMEQEVYRSLKLSYDHLQTEELKLCFLFCSLFPEDYEIDADQMIRCWMGEGFLEDVETLEEVLNKGHTLVEKIKAACLSLDCDKEGYVMMHDIVRDMAISIVSNDDSYKFFVRVGLALKEWPKVDRWEEYKKISMIQNEIEMLPERLECPELLTLMMQENDNFSKIPDRFFGGAKSLRVLDLGRTFITRLPSSMSYLLNLRELCLQGCLHLEIKGLSPLRSLKGLESLYLSRSAISELPAGIGELANLRRLDLSFNPSLKILPANVITKLTRLEELKMVLSFTGWEAAGTRRWGKSNASLAEVASLRQLSCLCLDIVEAGSFQQDIISKSWGKLERFCFRIDQLEYDSNVFDDLRSHRRMMIIDGHKSVPQWAKILFPRTTFPQLYYRKGLTTISGLDTEKTVAVSFESLEYLEIYKCLEMEYVLDGEGTTENMLQNLQHLSSIFFKS
ncbi:disease resistance protein At4g27190-like [Magnolia sinica]|uniref:disease resistance protein At4g27190-like n=1 Tax=Magnolia sinica TaxID=86752 RepID=UPI00265A50AF|nr:disease resistance protein At4g27190-like [Magnolia sinica]